MRKLLFAAAAMVLAPIGVAQAQDAPTAQTRVAGLQQFVGKEFNGGLKLVGSVAEGDVVVLTIDGPAGWREGAPPELIAQSLAQGMCSGMPDFFANGIKLRVDSLDAGADRQTGPVLEQCPAE